MEKWLVLVIGLFSSIMLSSAMGFTNICLRNGETIYFSECNPSMDNYLCSETSCQLCTNEVSSGTYCPASPQSCNNECFYLYDADQNSTITLVSPENNANMNPGDMIFIFQSSLPNTLDRCDLYINEVRKRYTSTPKLTNEFTVRSMEKGTYEWRIECKEKANYGGGTLLSSSRMLYLGEAQDINGTSAIGLLSPANSASFTGAQDISFRFNISSIILIGIQECRLYLDNSAVSSITTVNVENQINYNVGVGSHTWKVYCNNRSYASETRSLTVTAPSSGGGGGGGGGGISGNKTYVITEEQFAAGITRDLAPGDRFRFTINNNTHYLKLLSFTESIATIEASSTPQTANIAVGEEKKFELGNDNYYDLYVKLESINYTGNKTALTIKRIHEPAPFLIVNLTSWPNPGDLVYLYPEHPLITEGGFQYSFINSSTIDTCLLFIDSQIVATSKNNESNNDFSIWNYLVTNFTTEDIKHTWKVFCNDTAGFYNYSQIRTLYFLTYSKLLAPEVYLTWPNNNQIFNYNDNIYLYFNYSNTSAIKNCSLFVDGNLISYNNGTGNWTRVNEWPNSTGTHTWSYSCSNVYDSAGNSETRTYFIMAENIIPEDLMLIYETANDDLSDITGLFIGSINYSEGIYFNENVNLSKENNLSDFIVMTENRIYVDSTKAPWLNKSATLIFRDLTFNNPRILKDGVLFDVDFYYENGILIFDVTGFSEYRIEETPVPVSSGGGSSGGGGGGATPKTYSANNLQITSGYTQQLKKEEKIKFNLPVIINNTNKSEQHTITAKEITNKSVKIRIESTPIDAVLLMGEEKKFDLTADGIYDLSVKLNSADKTKANLTAKLISEKIEAEKGTEGAITKETPPETTEEENITKTNGGITGASIALMNGIKSNSVIISISIIIVVAVVVAVVISSRKTKRKNLRKKKR